MEKCSVASCPPLSSLNFVLGVDSRVWGRQRVSQFLFYKSSGVHGFPFSLHPFSKSKAFGIKPSPPSLCSSCFFWKTKGHTHKDSHYRNQPRGHGILVLWWSNLSSHIHGGRNSTDTSELRGWSQKDRSPEAKLTTVLGPQWSEEDLSFCAPRKGLRILNFNCGIFFLKSNSWPDWQLFIQ